MTGTVRACTSSLSAIGVRRKRGSKLLTCPYPEIICSARLRQTGGECVRGERWVMDGFCRKERGSAQKEYGEMQVKDGETRELSENRKIE